MRKLPPDELARRKKARKAAHYAKHKETHSAKAKLWREKNADKVKRDKAEYYKANHGRCLAKQSAYRAANPDKVKQATEKWVADNKDYKRAYCAAYAKRNRERLQESGRAYYESNKEKIKRDSANYRKANPVKKRQYENRRRAILLGSLFGDQLAIVRWEKAWRSKASVRCYHCRDSFHPKKCHADHVIALSKGGSHSIGNLCVSCGPCNLKKNAKTLPEWNALIEQPLLL